MYELLTYLPAHPPTYLPTHLPTHPPTNLPNNQPPTYPPTYLSTYLTNHPSNQPPTHLPTYLPTYQWWRSNSKLTSPPGASPVPVPCRESGAFFKAPSTSIRYFWVCNVFLADSKIFPSTRSIQVEFARPHVSGFRLSSSVNLGRENNILVKEKSVIDFFARLISAGVDWII